MLKRFLIIVLSACVLFSNSVFAATTSKNEDSSKKSETSVFEDPRTSWGLAPVIYANFMVWADAFGVPDILKLKPTNSKNDDGTAGLTVDDFGITYDSETFEPVSAVLFYDYEECDKSHQIMKALALFSALEYDAPDPWGDAEIGAAFEASSKWFSELCNVYATKNKEIKKGSFVPFHISKYATYYLSYDKDTGLVIYVR